MDAIPTIDKGIITVINEYRRLASAFGLDHTLLVNMSFLSLSQKVKIFAKDESQNVTGSVKVRSALWNIIQACNPHEHQQSSFHFLDASSGNYAKALIYLASKLGYQSTVFVPESASQGVRAYAAEHGLEARICHEDIPDSDDARKQAGEYSQQHPELAFLDQYNNPGSWRCHYHVTAEELLLQLQELGLTPTHLISGIGSGGTLIGLGKKFKEISDGIEVIGLASKQPHRIRGIRYLDEATLPGVYANSRTLIDRVVTVDPEEIAQFKYSYHLNFGVSGCTNVYASMQLSQQLEKGVIVTVIPDGGLS